MPELPEVETVLRGITPHVINKAIVSAIVFRPDLRVPFPTQLDKKLSGRRVIATRRRAKYMIWHLDDGSSLVIHLGMSGVLTGHDGNKPFVQKKHTHMVIRMDDGHFVTLEDPRRFGMVLHMNTADLEQSATFHHLGPEPLSDAFNADYLYETLHSRKTPVKTAIMDQSVVVGVGNIYASESLYLSRIRPTRQSSKVTKAECVALVDAIKQTLNRAIVAGGSSLRDYRQADGKPGYFQIDFGVYGRTGQKCPDCDCDFEKTGGIKKIITGNRSSFYCPTRQK